MRRNLGYPGQAFPGSQADNPARYLVPNPYFQLAAPTVQLTETRRDIDGFHLMDKIQIWNCLKISRSPGSDEQEHDKSPIQL